ncbi:hypothetical protein DFH27DRAFT_605473 [Peziza echinospora]|nr:hypothetical protein DFH27DRAFT_605473 [Peziza echinospora]
MPRGTAVKPEVRILGEMAIFVQRGSAGLWLCAVPYGVLESEGAREQGECYENTGGSYPTSFVRAIASDLSTLVHTSFRQLLKLHATSTINLRQLASQKTIMSAAPNTSPVRARQPASPASSSSSSSSSSSGMMAPNPTPITSSSSWMSHVPPPPPSSAYGSGGDKDSQELLSRRNLLAEAVKRASVAIVVRDLQEFSV